MTKRIISVILAVIVILSSSALLISCENSSSEPASILVQFNSFISKMIDKGDLEELSNEWKSADYKDKNVDYENLQKGDRTLVLGVKEAKPFVFKKGNKYSGYVVDIAYRFCKKYGYNLKLKEYATTDELIQATNKGECDFAGSNISITIDRQEKVDFSTPYAKNSCEVVSRKENKKDFIDVSSLGNRKIGVVDGGVYAANISKLNSKSIVVKYKTIDELYEGLENYEVDAIAYDKAVNDFLLPEHKDLESAFILYQSDAFAFAFRKDPSYEKGKSKLNLSMDSFIGKLKDDSKLDEIISKWEKPNSKADIDFSRLTGEKGTLSMAVFESKPFAYKKGDHFIGLSVDLAYQFCLLNGYKLLFKEYTDIDKMFTAVNEGKCDFAGSSISISNGRKTFLYFSNSYYRNKGSLFCRKNDVYSDYNTLKFKKVGVHQGSIYVDIIKDITENINMVEYPNTDALLKALENKEVDAIVHDSILVESVADKNKIVESFTVREKDEYAFAFMKKAEKEKEESGFVHSFYVTFIKDNNWKLFVSGLLTTLLITFSSAIAGSVLGLLVYLLCRKNNKVANVIVNICKRFVEGLPTAVVLMIFYYVIFGLLNIDSTVVSIIVFTLIFGAAVVNMLNTCVDAIDDGQREASYALGYTERRTFYKIILPQALEHIWGPYKGAIVSHLKATSIVGYIAVQDLTKISDIIRASTFEAFFPLITTAILYFVLGWLLTTIIKGIEKSVKPSKRKTKKFLKGVDLHD